jgi:DNA recombination protein RmuC
VPLPIALLLVLAAAVAGAAVAVLSVRRAGPPPDLTTAVEQVVAMADQRLGAHTARVAGATAMTEERIDARLTTLSAELARITDAVTAIERSRERQYGALHEQLSTAGRTTAELAETTRALREALASSRARGQWGERLAEDVLRLAGFREGVSYRRQRVVDGGGIPDFAFLLPEGREVRMDVKFPLDNYLRCLDAAGAAEAERHRRAFLRDVRARVREITTRDYLDPDVTVDCVLLFIPNESLYGFIHEHDPQVLDDALRQRVVLCSPSTLFAVLAVIRQAVDAFALARASDEILQLLGAFGREWERFCAQAELLGTHLERASGAYEALTTTRRRQLDRQLDRVADLRAQRGLAEPTPAEVVGLHRAAGS